MLTLTSINLPDQFTAILRNNVQAVDQRQVRKVASYITDNPSFLALIKHSFSDFEGEFNLEFLIHRVGWENFRTRLALYYIMYGVYGRFPSKLDEGLAADLTQFDQFVEPYTTSGNSRAFLLAFYLKMERVIKVKRESTNDYNFMIINKDLIDLLKFSKARSQYPDWMLLLLYHFDNFFGREKLTEFLKTSTPYEKIYEQLTHDQKASLCLNLLAYGYSINEPDIFHESVVWGTGA